MLSQCDTCGAQTINPTVLVVKASSAFTEVMAQKKRRGKLALSELSEYGLQTVQKRERKKDTLLNEIHIERAHANDDSAFYIY